MKIFKRFASTTTLAPLAAAALMLAVAPAQAAGDTAKGGRLAEKWCNSCHTVSAKGAARKFDAGPRFMELSKKSESYLKTAINRPHDFMPKFPKLSAGDKADLVAHIRSLK